MYSLEGGCILLKVGVFFRRLMYSLEVGVFFVRWVYSLESGCIL